MTPAQAGVYAMRGGNDARFAGVKDLARRKNARTGGRL